jgi:hypothetical protein
MHRDIARSACLLGARIAPIEEWCVTFSAKPNELTSYRSHSQAYSEQAPDEKKRHVTDVNKNRDGDNTFFPLFPRAVPSIRTSLVNAQLT